MTRVKLTAVVWKEEDVFVSKCPEIEVSSAGDTEEEALKNLEEAIDLWIENAKELGLVEEYLPMMTAAKKSTSFIEINV